MSTSFHYSCELLEAISYCIFILNDLASQILHHVTFFRRKLRRALSSLERRCHSSHIVLALLAFISFLFSLAASEIT